MREIKILHIITTLERGGAQKILFDVISRNKSKQYKHFVISLTEEKNLSKELEKHVVKIFHLNGKGILFFPILILKTLFLVKKIKPFYIQSWLYHADFIASVIGFIVNEIPIIWTIHHASYSLKYDSFHSKLIVNILSKFSKYIPKYIIYCSELSYVIHKKLGFKEKNPIVIHNGIDFQKFCQNKSLGISYRKNYSIKKNDFLIGIVGRYDPNKGIDCFLKAIKETKKTISQVKFIMCGTEMDNKNKELIEKLKSYNLMRDSILIGEQENMPAIYNMIDLLICSSLSESFGLVAIEALACRTNILGSDIPAFRKLIKKGNLIQKNNYKLFAKKIIFYYRNHMQGIFIPGAEKMNLNFERYDIKNTIDSYYEVYKKNFV